jgi:hypothetical protein
VRGSEMPTEKYAEIFPRTQQRKRRAVDEPRGTQRMRLGRYNCAYDSQESGAVKCQRGSMLESFRASSSCAEVQDRMSGDRHG